MLLDLIAAQRRPTWQPGEISAGVTRLVVGIGIVLLVYWLVRRIPWPRPFRFRFAALHALLAPLAALTWYAVSTPLESWVAPGGSDLVGRDRLYEMVFIGTIFYMIVAGIAYAAENSARAARAESAAARTQLAALRSQVNPHLLFNALHTILQLIPADPKRAAEATEIVGDLLRAALAENREEVTLAEEWRFVSKYLELERIRFGDRLVVRHEIPEALLDQCVPSFALQTLVENAVHHGAGPRVEPTEIVVSATASRSLLTLSVRNPTNGTAPSDPRAGTGLVRLRERLSVLYGSAARLEAGQAGGSMFECVLAVPLRTT